MDMGFALVHELSGRLYPDGFGCLGERCPSNDHRNGDRDYTPHDPHAGDSAGRKTCGCIKCVRDPREKAYHWHGKSGDYALGQEWL
jgi:hypothetical protein